jgi:MFS family permease
VPAAPTGGRGAALRARFAQPAAIHAAVRAAVVVPINFAVGSQLIGNAQVATFAAFGSFALLLFANFPGDRAGRLGAYVVLAVAGAGLISLGTLLASPDWLAVLAMAVIAFAVLFAGVVSSVVNGGTSAALLAFILAVLLPSLRADLPARLAGWGIACAVAIPVALFVWPPQDQNILRARTAALCRALATMLRLDPPAPGEPDRLVAMRRAARDLRGAFRTSTARTTALSTGARLLVRLVDEVEWLATAVTNACADAPDGWPDPGRRLRTLSAQVLAACGDAVDHEGAGPGMPVCTDLDAGLAALAAARTDVARSTLDSLRARSLEVGDPSAAGEFERPLYAAHELGYAVDLVGRTVATMGRADSRSWWARLLGRGVDLDRFGVAGAAQRAAARHLDRHSVWLQNSVRGAIGLAVAVLLARVVGSQNAFWIGLGALSVLRSNALATGATVLRAIAGTLVGFVIGGVAIALIGTDPAVLWPLLPVVVFIAAFAPAVISFVAGQAAFTVFSIILFNIIAPIGWRVGVLRVEDVALGCAAGLVAGVLLWPRGAAAALGVAYAEAYRSAARYLQDSVDSLTGHAAEPGISGPEATAAGVRLDDALRQYLAEQGGKSVPLESVAALANGAARLRLAGVAIADLRAGAPEGTVAQDGLAGPAGVLDRRAAHVTGWYGELADAFTVGRGAAPPPVPDGSDDASFLEVVLPAVERCGDESRAERAERLLWSGQYLGDVDRLRLDLTGPAAEVVAAQARPLWRR